MSNPYAVSLKGILKQLKGFNLGPIDLVVESGYVVAVVGSNGSGKSTLFRMMMNLVHPDEGEIWLLGERAGEDNILVKKRIGYVPEHSEDQDQMTVAEAADYVAHWYPSFDSSKYDAFLEQHGLEPKQKLKNLSKGVRRRFHLMLALARGPELLLLDEPSSGLDPFAWRDMIDQITDYVSTGGRSVIIATHILEEVRRLADYIVFIANGKMLGMFEKDTLLDDWKVLWIDSMPGLSLDLPGVVQMEESGGLIKLVTSKVHQTEQALSRQAISIVRTQQLELDEILLFLIHT